jgi:ABC-type phosphate transport system permease subunit
MRETGIGNMVIGWLLVSIFAVAVIIPVYSLVAGFIKKKIKKRKRKLGNKVYRPDRSKYQ